MPRSNKSNSRSEKKDANAGRRYFLPSDARWGGFVDLKLDAAQKGTFYDWYQHPENHFIQLMEEELGEGMALSLKWDAENECFVASYLGKGVSNSNERYCLTARAPNATEALALLEFKHRILLEGAWDTYLPKTGRLASWG